MDTQGYFVLGGGAGVLPAGNSELAAWRVTPAGAFDTSFGSPNGYVAEWGAADGGEDDNAEAIAIDGDGKVVLAGTVNVGDTLAGIWRFTSSGAIDTTFGGTGRIMFQKIAGPVTGPFDEATGIAVDSQNRIVFCGRSMTPSTYTFPYGQRAFVGRLLSSGAPDQSFGSEGFVILEPPTGGIYTWAYALAIDSLGRIVVAGESMDSNAINVAAWRLDATGALDTTYGTNGMFSVTHTAGPGYSDHAFAVAIDSTDRAVLAGYSEVPGAWDHNMAVWRLTP